MPGTKPSSERGDPTNDADAWCLLLGVVFAFIQPDTERRGEGPCSCSPNTGRRKLSGLALILWIGLCVLWSELLRIIQESCPPRPLPARQSVMARIDVPGRYEARSAMFVAKSTLNHFFKAKSTKLNRFPKIRPMKMSFSIGIMTTTIIDRNI